MLFRSTVYFSEHLTYKYIDNGTFYCETSDEFQRCDSVNNVQCFYGEIKVPKEFELKADRCYDLRGVSHNKFITISINIKTYFPSESDFLRITLIDKEKTIKDNKLNYELTNNSKVLIVPFEFGND